LGTTDGKWYEVECAKSLYGKNVSLVTTQKTYLSIEAIESFTGACRSTVDIKPPVFKMKPKVCYQKLNGCVNGENIKLHHGKSVAECSQICSDDSKCKGFEYFAKDTGKKQISKYVDGDC